MDTAAKGSRFEILASADPEQQALIETEADVIGFKSDEESSEAKKRREKNEKKKKKKKKKKDEESSEANKKREKEEEEEEEERVSLAMAAESISLKGLKEQLRQIDGLFTMKQQYHLKSFLSYLVYMFTKSGSSWATFLKNSPLYKIAEFLLCHISEPVYNTSVDWIAKKFTDALRNFVLWCLDAIFDDQIARLASWKDNCGKLAPLAPYKIQVAIFVVLAMVLKGKPDTVISILPEIKGHIKYQGHERLPVIVWVVAQAHQGDPVAEMFFWSHCLFPAVCDESTVNTQSTDLILQLVERILSGPKARSVLLNGAVGMVDRLVPPATLDLLMRITFPLHTSDVKVTERFKAVYPTIKELALAGSPGARTTKRALEDLLYYSFQAIKENNKELANEALGISVWCLMQNRDCFGLWERLYPDNIEASVAVMKKLSSEWKEYSGKISYGALRVTVKNLKAKNEEALSRGMDAEVVKYIKESDELCKSLLGKLSQYSRCTKVVIFLLSLAIAVSATYMVELEKQFSAYLS